MRDAVTNALIPIPAQNAALGSDRHYPEEGPVRNVHVDGFRIQARQVTNAEFAQFVDATGYVTVAERPLKPRTIPVHRRRTCNRDRWFPPHQWPGRSAAPGPMVDLDPRGVVAPPVGPLSSIDKRAEHPVVHIAYEDAEAYAGWAGLALPTEAEWGPPPRGLTARSTHGVTNPNNQVNGWPTTGMANSPAP